MENKLLITSSPHIKTPLTTTKIMLYVCLALVPALLASAYVFGLRVLLILFVTVSTCVLSEYICRKVMKRDNTIGDLSAVVTGMLLTCSYPVSIPLFIAAFGAVVAIVVVKQMFGGIGDNFVNPAIAARIVLVISFPAQMSNWSWTAPDSAYDALTGATPLQIINSAAAGELPSYTQMLFGIRGGSVGETCAVLLIAGGVFLIIAGIITPTIPVSYIGTVALCSLILGYDVTYQVLGGALILGAFFMATDYTTSPMTEKGKLIFGIGCGALTALFRFAGGMAEGVSFAIILMNILVPHIEKFTRPGKSKKGTPQKFAYTGRRKKEVDNGK